jgi:hypothetical protein
MADIEAPCVRKGMCEHEWRLPWLDEPLEVSGVCRHCGAYADAEADAPCLVDDKDTRQTVTGP